MDLIKEKWQEILDTVRVELEMTQVSFAAWLEPLTLYSLENNVLNISLSEDQNIQHMEVIKQKYAYVIKVAIKAKTGINCDLNFMLYEETKLNSVNSNEINSTYNNNEKTIINQKYTFDTFVVGSNNKFAYSASLAVAECPGKVYNPLFLYGGVGLGKTHLMKSIEHYVLTNYPQKKVLYITSEYFTNDLIEAIRNGNNTAMAKFREKYRNVDVLLIDDIQFIIGKESTQEEFFHTFNDLHALNKQIIISSDKPPKDFETLEERFKTRFEMGLIADIQAPDYETRMAILRKKEEIDGFYFDDEIINYVATNIKSNIRELEGALNKLIAFSNLENVKITLEIAERELQNIIFPNKPKEITPQLILNIVGEHFHVKPEDICSSKRNSEIVIPRQISMYLCNTLTDLSLQNICKSLGNRDHSTVLHGVNKIKEEINKNESLKNTIDTIIKKLNP